MNYFQGDIETIFDCRFISECYLFSGHIETIFDYRFISDYDLFSGSHRDYI